MFRVDALAWQWLGVVLELVCRLLIRNDGFVQRDLLPGSKGKDEWFMG